MLSTTLCFFARSHRVVGGLIIQKVLRPLTLTWIWITSGRGRVC